MLDPTCDAYDMAFVLFAHAWMFRLTGDASIIQSALNTVAALDAVLAHPSGLGWRAYEGYDGAREQNPHMQVLRDLREPADARPECKSPFGVENMTGNMDEPVAREGFENNAPFRNALKGGWWMPARNRCRPATTAHDDYFKDLQIGVRCCDGAGP